MKRQPKENHMFHLDLQTINVIAIVDQWVNQTLTELQNHQQINLFDVCEFLNEYQPYLIDIYLQGYEYSGAIHAFVKSVESVLEDKYYEGVTWNQELAEQFVIRLSAYKSLVIGWYANQAQQEEKNRSQLRIYTNQLINHYARLLFVRVDLSYLSDKRPSLTPEDFDNHMNKLMEHISNKKGCFKGLQGYAWAIEQGIDKGYHCHLLLMYDGARHHKDYGLAVQVGEKWRKITADRGCYFNCSCSERKQYLQANGALGLGMIHRDNPVEISNAMNTALYLTEPSKQQFLIVKLANMRTFGKGQFNVSWRRDVNRM